VSSVTVTDSSWNGRSFLQVYVLFEFVSDVRIEVTCIDVNFMGGVVILLGPCVKKISTSPSLGLTYTPVM